MATIAASTERIRIGTFVFNNDLRHPAVLAQELASLDVLSRRSPGDRDRSRLEPARVRRDRPALRPGRDAGRAASPSRSRCSRAPSRDGPFSFAGEHYTIVEHDGQPKPVQRPHPPLFLGGGGRRLLSLAGREADIVGLAPRLLAGDTGRPRSDPRSLTAAATAEKIGWIRDAAGPRFAGLELNTYPTGGPIVVTDHARAEAAARADRMRRRTGVEISADELLESPHTFIGSIDGLARKFVDLREQFGISSFMTGGIDELAPVVERLAGT